MASVALALLVLFTTLRAQRLAKDSETGLGELKGIELAALGVDLALAVIIFGGCAAMWSLFTASFSLSEWATRQHALQSMFTIVYVTFAALLVCQLAIFGIRLWTNTKNTLAAHKHANRAGSGGS